MQYPGRALRGATARDRPGARLRRGRRPAAGVRPAAYGPQLSALLNRIAYHLDHQPQTPYREAIFQVKRRVEAAQRGETPPAFAAEEKPEATVVAAVGQAAPDFLAPDLATSSTFRLGQVLGKPVLLVFYNPASPTAADVLGYAQQMSASHAGDLTVLALSMSGDLDAARKQRADSKLTLPVLDGSRPAHQLRRRRHAEADAPRRRGRAARRIHRLGPGDARRGDGRPTALGAEEVSGRPSRKRERRCFRSVAHASGSDGRSHIHPIWYGRPGDGINSGRHIRPAGCPAEGRDDRMG